jgi:hypothetical protein
MQAAYQSASKKGDLRLLEKFSSGITGIVG